MPNTTVEKNNLATKYGVDAAFCTLFSTAPSGNTPGTEIAVTRQAISWGAPSGGVTTATVTFSVPSGVTVNGAGFYSASTAGTYIDGGSVTPQAFATAGTYQLTLTYTQT